MWGWSANFSSLRVVSNGEYPYQRPSSCNHFYPELGGDVAPRLIRSSASPQPTLVEWGVTIFAWMLPAQTLRSSPFLTRFCFQKTVDAVSTRTAEVKVHGWLTVKHYFSVVLTYEKWLGVKVNFSKMAAFLGLKILIIYSKLIYIKKIVPIYQFIFSSGTDYTERKEMWTNKNLVGTCF